MKRTKTLLALATVALCLGRSAHADDAAAAKLLFAKDAGDLSDADRVAIVRMLELQVSPDGKELVETVCSQPVTADVRISDMNGDGTSEVLVEYGNSCLSGMAGTSVALFVKSEAGGYRLNLGVPGTIAETLASKSHGHPDLLIGGPGFCFAVWRWNGREYAHLRNEPQSPGGCDGVK